MARLVLFAVLLAVLAVGVFALLGILTWLSGPKQKEASVSDQVRRVAYIVLIVLMFGVTSGAMGMG